MSSDIIKLKNQNITFTDFGNDIKIFNNDCFNIMGMLEAHSIDFILCDLPYGITRNKWDKKLPFVQLWESYKRIIKPNGCIALFASGIFYIDLVNSNRSMFKYDLIWDKMLTSGFLNANKRQLRRHEQIAIFYDKQPSYDPQYFEDKAKPLHSTGIKSPIKYIKNSYNTYIRKQDLNAGICRKFPTSIITYKKTHSSRMLVPTQKPVELCEYLIKTYTKPRDIVLDNCMGSGTTGVACMNSNRKFVGIELNEKHFNIAKERLTKEYYYPAS